MIIFSVITNDDDRQLTERLYQQYKNLMFIRAFDILRDEKLAEDAVHQSFIKIINNLHKIIEENCPRTRNFLVIICENVAKDIYNKRIYLNNNSAAIDELDNEISQEATNPLDIIVNEESINRLVGLIDELKPIYRDVIQLFTAHKCSYAEIAEMLNIPIETVRKRMYRGRKELAALLNLEREGRQ